MGRGYQAVHRQEDNSALRQEPEGDRGSTPSTEEAPDDREYFPTRLELVLSPFERRIGATPTEKTSFGTVVP